MNFRIRVLEDKDKKFLLEWTNKKELWSSILKHRFVNSVEHEVFFKNLCFDNSKDYFIIEKESPIGLCGLTNIDFLNSKAELFIFISDKKSRGENIGSYCIDYLIDYAFESLSLNKLYLRVESKNNAYNLYLKKGFKVEGKLIDDFKFNNMFYDVYYMSFFNTKIQKVENEKK